MVLTPLTSAAEVILASDHDPYVRGRLARADVVGWSGFGAVAWRYADLEERARYVMTHGEPPAVAQLLEALLADELRDGQDVTVPRGTAPLLPAWVGLDGTQWDLRWTTARPPHQPGEERVRPVTDDAVRPLLAVANPDAAAQPGDERVRRWVGIEDESGLVACAADTTEATGVGHISSIAVHPEARGQGLGSAVTAALARQLFDEGCDVVTLGMYADNTAGRALYDRLGMHERGFTSGKLRIRSRW